MNKKILMFGMAGLLSLVLVTALVVDYVSNKATADIDVKSPIEITLTEVNGSLSDIYGGETVKLMLYSEKKSKVESIDGHYRYTVTNDLGLTPDDFAFSLFMKDAPDTSASNWVQVDANTITYDAPVETWTGLGPQTGIGLEFEFLLTSLGNYELEVQIIYN